MRTSVVLLACAAPLWAQSGIQSPFLGQMIDAHGQLRPVYGMSGSFVLGAPLRSEHVLGAACSLTLCLAKTQAAILSSTGAPSTDTTPSPPGGAIFALDGTAATVYFPLIHQFARWQNGVLTPLDFRVEGTVLSLTMSSTGVLAAVERSGIIWIDSASTGASLDSLPDSATSVLLLPSLTVYATADSLVIRKSDGSELDFPAPQVSTLLALGNGYVEAIGSGALYALRTVSGREQLFQLPGTLP